VVRIARRSNDRPPPRSDHPAPSICHQPPCRGLL